MRSYTSNLERDVDGLVCQRKAKIVDVTFMAEKKSGKKTGTKTPAQPKGCNTREAYNLRYSQQPGMDNQGTRVSGNSSSEWQQQQQSRTEDWPFTGDIPLTPVEDDLASGQAGLLQITRALYHAGRVRSRSGESSEVEDDEFSGESNPRATVSQHRPCPPNITIASIRTACHDERLSGLYAVER